MRKVDVRNAGLNDPRLTNLEIHADDFIAHVPVRLTDGTERAEAILVFTMSPIRGPVFRLRIHHHHFSPIG